jgi:hypothetical protein
VTVTVAIRVTPAWEAISVTDGFRRVAVVATANVVAVASPVYDIGILAAMRRGLQARRRGTPRWRLRGWNGTRGCDRGDAAQAADAPVAVQREA